MTDKTVSLTNRQVNQSLRTRKRAEDIHLRKQKVDLDNELRHCQHQLSLKQKGLQDKLQKLRLRQKVTAAFLSKPDTSKDMEAESTTPSYRPLLEPINSLADPYPVTFIKTGTKTTPNPSCDQTKEYSTAPKFPKIVRTSSKTLPLPINTKYIFSQSIPKDSSQRRNVNDKDRNRPRDDDKS